MSVFRVFEGVTWEYLPLTIQPMDINHTKKIQFLKKVVNAESEVKYVAMGKN